VPQKLDSFGGICRSGNTALFILLSDGHRSTVAKTDTFIISDFLCILTKHIDKHDKDKYDKSRKLIILLLKIAAQKIKPQ